MSPRSRNAMYRQSDSSPWRALAPVSLGTALSLIGDSALYTVLPTHRAEAGIMLIGVGILLSANRFIRLLVNGMVGWAVDRRPRRHLFVPALFLGALSTAVYALTTGFWPLLLGRLLWGVAWAGIWVTGNTIILDATRLDNRGRWIGFYHTSFFLGASLGALLGGLLTDWLGYRGAMTVAAALTFLGATVALIFLPETGRYSSHQVETDRHPKVDLPPRNAAEIVSATVLLGVNRVVIAGILLSTFGLFLSEQIGETIVVYGRSIGVATLTGLGLSMSTMLSMLAAPLAGGLSDRLGSRWRVAAGGLLPGIAGFGLLAWGAPAAVLLGLPLTSLTGGSNQSLSTALMGDLSGDTRRGRSLGILYTIGDLGSAIGPPLAYALIPIWGTRGIYGLSSGLLVLMFLVALRFYGAETLRRVVSR